MPALTDLSTIRSLCDRYGFSLSKGFGQNFIINPGVCPRIAEAAGIGPEWGVLEIGPGIGVLTEQLAMRAARVVSVEIDRRLPPLLAETLAGYNNVRIVEGDVLKVDLKALIRKAHSMGLAVVMDLVQAHYVKNINEGLNELDGTDLYSPPGDAGNQPYWDSKLFDYGKDGVQHFLLSNVKYWLDEFHFDGFRFDGVTSMIYRHHGYL